MYPTGNPISCLRNTILKYEVVVFYCNIPKAEWQNVAKQHALYIYMCNSRLTQLFNMSFICNKFFSLLIILEEAKKLTDQAKGKHHIGDFLPPDELKKFMAKVKSVKGEKGLEDIDLSDYAEFKLTEDNVGYQMLKKAGWTEGSGLGSKGQGITAPINK